MRSWYSLFSHTGEETYNLWTVFSGTQCGNLLKLEGVLTTNMQYCGKLPSSLVKKMSKSSDINAWLMDDANVKDNSVITLNGYMRILPAEVIDHLRARGCTILNVHPAPIHLYLDLRGKDPQERLYAGILEGRYSYMGVVIHDVDAGVDTGTIRHWIMELADPSMTKDQMYRVLHEQATQAWLDFLPEVAHG